jgi:protoheme IX farnesyltransferase
MYQEDYARAGIRMLPVVEPDGSSTGRQIVLYAAALVPVSLAPTFLNMTGWIYFAAALVFSLAYLYYGVLSARHKTGSHARRVLQASVLYLPLIYCFLVLNKL